MTPNPVTPNADKQTSKAPINDLDDPKKATKSPKPTEDLEPQADFDLDGSSFGDSRGPF
jgi:hypothetical protein